MNGKSVIGHEDKKSHLFGGRELGDSEDVLKREFIDDFAVIEHNTVEITFLVGVTDISHNNRFGLSVKVDSDFHGILLVCTKVLSLV